MATHFGRILPKDVTTHKVEHAIKRFENDPEYKEDVAMMRTEIENRIGIWMRRGHTRDEAIRIMGLQKQWEKSN